MSAQREALKLALEAMQQVHGDYHSMPNRVGPKEAFEMMRKAITAIKEALAQPDYRAVKTYHEGKPVYVSQPEQEPVAWRYDLKTKGSFAGISTEYSPIKLERIGKNWTPLYTTPPKCPWVGLTGLEQKELMSMSAREAVFTTEAKLKEKNT